MYFLQAINSDLSVLIVCNKTGGTIKGDITKKFIGNSSHKHYVISQITLCGKHPSYTIHKCSAVGVTQGSTMLPSSPDRGGSTMAGLTLWPRNCTFKQQHIIYVKCEYFTNQKRQRYEIHDILQRNKLRLFSKSQKNIIKYK